jgi:hypothetical protein
LFLSGTKVLVTNKFRPDENKKKGCFYGNSLTLSPYSLPLIFTIVLLLLSDGFGVLVVVSTGIVAAVSLPIPDGCVVAVSLIEGDVVSEPVDFSGVSQPIVANAKKAMKRMLFMRNTFSYEYL